MGGKVNVVTGGGDRWRWEKGRNWRGCARAGTRTGRPSDPLTHFWAGDDTSCGAVRVGIDILDVAAVDDVALNQ